MNRLATIVLVAVLAGCATPGQKSAADDPTRAAMRERARIHTELGALYAGAGQMKTAVDEFKEALAADPDYGPAHNQLGLVYMSLGEDRLAQASFERALRIDPNDSAANNNYGMFLCRRKREKEAFKYFREELKNPLYTTPENAYANAGVCARIQGDDVKAEELLRKALALQPNHPQALYQLAEIQFIRGDRLGALNLLDRHLQVVSSPSVEALWLGARIADGLGKRNEVASYGMQLNNRYPDAAQTKAFNEGRFQ
ncbi:MAG: type IV pilus biogenesis/stability protein PilW [Betaproteobacteria bacterium]